LHFADMQGWIQAWDHDNMSMMMGRKATRAAIAT
jgi:hypothetical protein